MKKKIFLFSLVLSALLCVFTISAFAVEVDGIYYSLNEAKLEATVSSENRTNCTLETVNIPSSIEVDEKTYAVVAIAENAFGSVDSGSNTYIKHVTIPDSITSFGIYAFREVDCLISVTINASNLTGFSNAEFYGCDNLTSVDMSACTSFTSLGGTQWGHTFYGCSKLSSVKLPPNLEAIKQEVFFNCSALKSIELPSSLLSIGSKAFNSTGLTSIEIPDGVTSLSDYVFQGCRSLSSVKLPKNLTYLGKNNFQYAPVTNIVIPHTLVQIQNHVFHSSSIQTVIFASENVTSFNAQAFDGASSLKLVFFPGDETSAKTFAAKDNKLKSWTNFVSYDKYDPTATYSNTIVYGTPVCSGCSNIDNSEVEFTFTDFTSKMFDQKTCASCGKTDVKKEYAPIITIKGYTKEEGTESSSFAYGFTIDKASLLIYETNTGLTVSYGIIVGSAPENATGDIIDKNGNSLLSSTVTAEFSTATLNSFSIYNIKLTEIKTDAQKALSIYCNAYAIAGEKISYLGEIETKKAVAVSYNTLPVKA